MAAAPPDPNKKIEGDIDRFDDVLHQYGDDIDEANDANIDFDQFFTSFHKDDDDDDTTTMENIDYEAFFDDFHKKDDTDENLNMENIDYSAFFTEFESDDDKKDKNIAQDQQINPNVAITLTTTEEQRLSKKLSELSSADKQQIDVQNKPIESLARTTTTTTDKKRPILTPTTPVVAVTTKKLKTDIVELSSSATGTGSGSGHDGADYMPKYLSNSRQTFEDIINPIFQKADNPFCIEDLRQIAILEHKIKLIDLNTLLWTTYLRSGTNKLKENEQPHLQAAAGITTTSVRSNPSIWPQELKTIMLADRRAKFKPDEIDHDKCLNYVMKTRRTFREQNTVYQMQLKERKQRLNTCFTPELEEAVKTFVEEYGIRSHRIVIERDIAVIKYDYNDKLFEADFYHETPYQEQVTTFKNLSQLKLEKEKSKMDVKLLKQRVVHNQLSSVFDSMKIPLPATLNTIEDQLNRQSLIYRYEQLLQRTKSDLITTHVRTAELNNEEATKKFNSTFKEYNNIQRTGDITKKLTRTMAYIMEQRFKNIDERLETLYNLKLRFFVKAPTVGKN